MKVYLIGNNLSSLILAYILSQKNLNVMIYSVKPSTTVKSSNSNFKTRTLGLTSFNYIYLKNYFNKKIIHMIVKKFIFDEKNLKEYKKLKYQNKLNFLNG